MVVNGNSPINQSIWCTTMPSSANTEYYFSAWMTTLNPISPAQLQITVNGAPVGTTFAAGGAPCNWQQFGAAFNSGAATSINICITNQNGGNGFFGNDFALDDMELSSVCTVTDDVMVAVLAPEANITAPPIIDCNAADLCVTLDGMAVLPIGTVSYQWTASNGGMIQSGANSATPVVCGTGDYSLVVTEMVGLQSCSSTPFTIGLTDNMAVPPTPTINGPIEICENIAGNFSILPNPAYAMINWLSNPGMTIIAGQGTEAVDIIFSNLDMTDVCVVVENNCNQMEQVCFPININQPPDLPIPSGPLTVCDQNNPIYTILNIDPTVFNYTWTATGGGQVVDGQGTSSVTLDWTGSTGGQICAMAENGCGTSLDNCIDITVTPQTVVTNITLTTLDPAEVGVMQTLYPSSTGCDSLVIETTVLIMNLCNVTADAGPDVTACANDGPIQLNGLVGGNNVLGFEWTPATGLSDPNSLTPLATVNTTTTYTLTGQSLDDASLIQNGDFEQGNVLFSTLYTLGTTSCGGFGFLDCEGTYGVLNNPNLGHTNFAACGDHTSGGGNMMVVNGAASLQDVWCQTINVTPGAMYNFSAWVASVNSSSPAILQFSINGGTNR